MKTLFISLSFLLLLNCNNDDEEPTPFEPIEIEFTTIGQDALTTDGDEGIPESNLIITNSTDWTNLMDQIDTVNSHTDAFNETDIDFDTYLILAIFLEVKYNGWIVEIDSIIENENVVLVSYSDTPMIGDWVAQPFHIVKIPVTSKPIEFINN